MKRYVVFAGDRSYARGGAMDFLTDFSNKKSAENFRRAMLAQSHSMWCHIWDSKEHRILPDTEEDEHGHTGGITGD